LREEIRPGLSGAESISGVRERVGQWRDAKETIALVPTMGNLHEGHLSLIRLASQHARRVICSIFVNPTQFRDGEDYTSYPRTLQEDKKKLGAQGLVDLIFCPSEQDIYPLGAETSVEIKVPGLSSELCGATRPGHFSGVASVVCRLLNITMPDTLLLGEKDYQQLLILTRMIEDLKFPVTVVSAPIFRESDGLAMSSRNQYLTGAERQIAPVLYNNYKVLHKLYNRVYKLPLNSARPCAIPWIMWALPPTILKFCMPTVYYLHRRAISTWLYWLLPS